MKVLVTGGAGFVGSHVIDSLLRKGYEVLIVDDLSSGTSANIPAGVRFLRLDVSQPGAAEQMAAEHPDYIIHLAAQVNAVHSVADPFRDAQVNILGTIHVSEAARLCHARKVVFASSAAVYGEPTRLPLPEEHPLAPVSPYGLSKHTAERYLLSGSMQGKTPVAVLRLANVYGPRQLVAGEGAVVPSFICEMAAGRPPVLHGDGGQTRDFVYVADAAEALLRAMLVEGTQVVNIGMGRPVSIRYLFSVLAKQIGYTGPVRVAPARPGDIRHSYFDVQQAGSLLQWRATTELERGLAATVAYFAARLIEQEAAAGLDGDRPAVGAQEG